MKNKILIPLLITATLAAFFSFKYISGDGDISTERKALVMERVVDALQRAHFNPKAIDDSFSHKVYNEVLDNLDPGKVFFTKGDIAQLKPYEYKIDDEINGHTSVFFDKLNEVYKSAIDRAEAAYKEGLATPFTFAANETIQLDGEKLDYAADDAAIKGRWRQMMKYRTLVRYTELKKEQEKPATDKKDKPEEKQEKVTVKSDSELEEEARKSVTKNQENYFKRLRKLNDEERYAIFVNAAMHIQDPHTDYFPPVDKKRFDEQMSGSFFGIGAQLKMDDGKIMVESLVPGSPAYKQGELKAGDEIIKVAQGAAEPEDIQGWDLPDAVTKIRGEKGSEVRLTVKKMDGAQKVVRIIRDKVETQETFARSAVIDSKTGPVGYIYLPEFYADFNNTNGRRCAEDVAIEVVKLKAAGVKGIILDLRHNGGGSLTDVVDMAGLFIDKGPIVQVKSGSGAPMTLKDSESGTLYDGPLAIMVNQGSASASEIMAAAMQDYGRAIIVGTPTFGKGTVQKILPLDKTDMFGNPMAMNGDGGTGDEIGSLKLTVQKFYRVNGGSTQLRGVTPDIILPDIYQYINFGERRDKASLPWDEIAPANYSRVPNAVNVPQLAAASNQRIKANPVFKLITENALRLKKKDEDNTASLNEAAYRKELDEANATSKKMEELEKNATLLKLTNPKEDMTRINADSTTIRKNTDWLKSLSKDIYIAETVNIINDMKGNVAKSSLTNSTGRK